MNNHVLIYGHVLSQTIITTD